MKKVLVLSLALILLLGIMSHGTSAYFSDTETSAGNTFTAWTTEPPKFFVSDNGDNTLYKYDASGNLVGTTDLAKVNSFPSGVAVVEDNVFILDWSDKGTYLYIAGAGTPFVSRTFLTIAGSGIGSPSGLAIDGDDIWVVTWGADNLYRYSLTAAFDGTGTLNALQEIPLDANNVNSMGLAIDSTYLYVLDSTDHQFYRYDRSTGVCGVGDVSKVLKESLVSGGGDLYSPAGAMLDGTFLWVVDDSQAQQKDKVYKYDMTSTNLFPDDGTFAYALWQFDLDDNNKGSSGL